MSTEPVTLTRFASDQHFDQLYLICTLILTLPFSPNTICASDIFGSQEEWCKLQQEILSTQSQEVIDAYGEEYISSMVHTLSTMTTQTCDNFKPVLDDLQHALLSKNPRAFYYPGPMAWAVPALQRICPTHLFDAIFARLLTYKALSPAGVAIKK